MMSDSPGDAQRRHDLVRMRTLATGLLVLAAVIYVVTLRPARTGWMGWVNAGSEAAMVGALADWFAVTAIFRHPLGIPIPHTALVKKRKSELGKSLQQFVTGNFLTADIFADHVADAQVGRRVAGWLSDRENRERLLAQTAKGVKAALERVSDDDVHGLMSQTIVPRLKEQQVGPLAGALLADVVHDGSHQQVIDVLAKELQTWLERNPEAARRVIGERAPSWSPAWMDKQVVDFGYRQAMEWVVAVRAQPGHPFRAAASGWLQRLADDLRQDEATQQKASAVWGQLLDNPSVGPAVVELWGTVRGSITQAVDDRDSHLWRTSDQWLADLAQQLESDEALRERLDARVSEIVTFLVETYGDDVASVITTTVDSWDADEASDKIELFVGRDLQFIRINGTVVGCLAGLVIHGISQLV